MSDPQFGMFPKDVDSKSGEMSEWSIEHAWKACESELRGSPGELQIQMVAGPRFEPAGRIFCRRTEEFPLESVTFCATLCA
jgi:hypothetical protein